MNSESDDASAFLRIERGGAADAPVIVTLSVELGDAKAYTVAFDDPALPGLPAGSLAGEESEGSEYRRIEIAKGQAANALIESMRKAKAIVVTRQPAKGKKLDSPVSRISMSGAVASLLWIDDQQKRIDTVTALARRGPKPVSAVPPQPKAPVIVAAEPSAGIAPKPSADLIARGRKACDNDKNAHFEQADRLGANLFLYYVFCSGMSGAYNMHGVYFIVPADQPKAGRLVNFNGPVRTGNAIADSESGVIATNSSFDPKTMTLQTFNKGRGLGDCGSQSDWVFDGRSFQLALERTMTECRRIPMDDWPVTFRAEVKR